MQNERVDDLQVSSESGILTDVKIAVVAVEVAFAGLRIETKMLKVVVLGAIPVAVAAFIVAVFL